MANTGKREYKETYVLEGETYWAKVYTPDDSNKYSAEMSLTKEGEKLCKSLGIPVNTSKTDPSRPPFIKFTRFATDFETKEVKPMKVIDADGLAFDKLIGNGSLCRVEFFARDWTYGKKTGTQAYMVGLQVVDHIPYTPPTQGKLTGSIKDTSKASDYETDEDNEDYDAASDEPAAKFSGGGKRTKR